MNDIINQSMDITKNKYSSLLQNSGEIMVINNNIEGNTSRQAEASNYSKEYIYHNNSKLLTTQSKDFNLGLQSSLINPFKKITPRKKDFNVYFNDETSRKIL